MGYELRAGVGVGVANPMLTHNLTRQGGFITNTYYRTHAHAPTHNS